MANNFFIVNIPMVTIQHVYQYKYELLYGITTFSFSIWPLTLLAFTDQIKTAEILMATVTLNGQTVSLLQSKHHMHGQAQLVTSYTQGIKLH